MTATLKVQRRIDPWWPFRLWVHVRGGPEIALHGGRARELELPAGTYTISASLAGWAAVPVTIRLDEGTSRRVRVRVRSSWVLTLRSKRRPYEAIGITVE